MSYRFLKKPAMEMQAMALSKLKEIKTKAVKQKAIKPSPASDEAAYFRALARGFEGGDPDDDWYAAEAEIKQAADH